MADNDNTIDIVIQAFTDDFITKLGKTNGAFAITNGLLERFYSLIDRAPNVNKLANALVKIADVNMKNVNSQMKALTGYMSEWDTSLNSDTVKSFNNNIYALSNTLDTFNKSLKTLETLGKKDIFDFTNLEKLDLAPLTSFTNKINEMSPEKMSAIGDSINSVLNSMSKLNNVKFTDTDTRSSGVDSKMQTLTNTLKSYVDMISKFNLNGLTSFTKDIQELPKMMKAMESINAKTVTNNIDMLTKKLQSFIATLKEGSADIKNFSTIISTLGKGANTASLSKGVKETTNSVKNLGGESEKTNKKLSNMLSAGKLYALYNQIRHFGRGFLDLLNKSIDFNEVENYFARAMGNMYKEAMKFQNKLGDMFGLAMPQMMQAQATFKNMLSAIGGLDDDVTYMLSERLTKMALDFSSLYNTTIEQAMTKFQAALSKQVNFCPLYMGIHSEFLLIAGNLSPLDMAISR